MKIHPTAIIDPHAELDEGVEVQPYSIIGPHVRIGKGTIVGPHCVIDGRTTIGQHNHFYSGAQVGVRSQDLKHHPDFVGRLEMGDHNVVREHASLSAATVSGAEDENRVTVVGSHCLLMTCAHVGHDCRLGDYVIMANCAALAGHVVIEDRAILGGLAAVHQFCRVGKMAMVGGTTRVWHDAPPYMTTDGNPARCHGPNTIGLQRNGIDEAGRKRIKKMYKILWRSGLNTTQALEEIDRSVEDSPERSYLTEFVRTSERGMTR